MIAKIVSLIEQRGQIWLAPDQVRVITLNDDKALINYAQPIVAEVRVNMVRVDSDFSATPFKAKISNAELREPSSAVAMRTEVADSLLQG